MPYQQIHQGNLMKKMASYLKREGRQFDAELFRGYCHALSLLMAYRGLLSPEHAHRIAKAMSTVGNWDEKSDIHQEAEFLFNAMQWLQKKFFLMRLVAQQTTMVEAIDFIKAKNDPGIRIEFKMGFLFRCDEIAGLLSRVLKYKKAGVFRSQNHVVTIIYDADKPCYRYFNTNIEDSTSTELEGFVDYDDIDKLANKMIEDFNLENIRIAEELKLTTRALEDVEYVPLAFHVISLDLEAKPAEYASAADMINEILQNRAERGLPFGVDEAGWENVNALMMACKVDDIASARTIIRAAKNVPGCLDKLMQAKDVRGKASPVDYAIVRDSLEMVTLLVEEGHAYVDAIEARGRVHQYLQIKRLEKWFAKLAHALEMSDIDQFEEAIERLFEILPTPQEVLTEFKHRFGETLLSNIVDNDFIAAIKYLEQKNRIGVVIDQLDYAEFEKLCRICDPSFVAMRKVLARYREPHHVREAIRDADIEFLEQQSEASANFVNDFLVDDFPFIYAIKSGARLRPYYFLDNPRLDKDKLIRNKLYEVIIDARQEKLFAELKRNGFDLERGLPLLYAVEVENLAAARTLLHLGARPGNAILIAIGNQQPEMVALLMQHGAVINNHAITAAIETGHPDVISLFADYPSVRDLSFRSAEGDSLFMMALEVPDITEAALQKIFNQFYAHGSAEQIKTSLNELGSHTRHPLYHVMKKRFYALAYDMMEYKAEIPIKTFFDLVRRHPPQTETEKKSLQICLAKILRLYILQRDPIKMKAVVDLARQFDLDIVNVMLREDGQNALHYACASPAALGKPDTSNLVHLLLEDNANPRLADRNGDTPLHFAARAGNVKAISWLRKAGAEPTAYNDQKIPALCVGNVERRSAMLDLLSEVEEDIAEDECVAFYRSFQSSPLSLPIDQYIDFLIGKADELHALVKPATPSFFASPQLIVRNKIAAFRRSLEEVKLQLELPFSPEMK